MGCTPAAPARLCSASKAGRKGGSGRGWSGAGAGLEPGLEPGLPLRLCTVRIQHPASVQSAARRLHPLGRSLSSCRALSSAHGSFSLTTLHSSRPGRSWPELRLPLHPALSPAPQGRGQPPAYIFAFQGRWVQPRGVPIAGKLTPGPGGGSQEQIKMTPSLPQSPLPKPGRGPNCPLAWTSLELGFRGF